MKITLYFIRETEKARLYSRVRPDRNPLDQATEEDKVWVPRSITEHTTKYPDGTHIIDLPDWFIEKAGL